jgi:hypothetical protein
MNCRSREPHKHCHPERYSGTRAAGGRKDLASKGNPDSSPSTAQNDSLPFALVLLAMSFAAGCAHQPKPTTRPSLATTQPSFWYAQPPAATVTSTDFDRLWHAAEIAARDRGFTVDRQDYRAGLLTTVPLTSKQWFEIWRNDVQTPEDLAKSSLATYRRTLQFQIEKRPDGSFKATPQVLIERYVQAERPITASVYLSRAFRGTRNQRHPRSGSPEADRGIRLPTRYWYPTGRDTVLERDVAKAMEHRLR